MTREEAIKVLRTESVEISGNYVTVGRFFEALNVAIKALEADDMWVKLDPVIIGKAYPVVCGNGWRCFDGEKWHDCDRNGNIIKRGR